MNFLSFEYFVTIAKELNITSAARHLHVSQQALSSHLSKLEKELGVPLFFRSNPLVLTREGEYFLNYCNETLKLQQDFKENIKLTNYSKQVLRVGIGTTLGRSILPYALPSLLNKFPYLQFRFIEDAPENLKKSIEYDGLDIVIGSLSKLPKSYKMIKICDKKQLLVVPKTIMQTIFQEKVEEVKSSFYKNGSVDLSLFKNVNFIKMDSNYAAGRIQNEYFKYYNINPSYSVELVNCDVAFQLAVSGIGVLIYSELFYESIPKELRKYYEEKVDVFKLTCIDGLDSIYAYYHQPRRLSDVTKSFLEIVCSFVQQHE